MSPCSFRGDSISTAYSVRRETIKLYLQTKLGHVSHQAIPTSLFFSLDMTIKAVSKVRKSHWCHNFVSLKHNSCQLNF